jgi:SAM-dependent methyltransferase
VGRLVVRSFFLWAILLCFCPSVWSFEHLSFDLVKRKKSESVSALLCRSGYKSCSKKSKIYNFVTNLNKDNKFKDQFYYIPYYKCFKDGKVLTDYPCKKGWIRPLENFMLRFEKELTDHLSSLKAKKNVSVLEVGIGTGRVVSQLKMMLPQARVVGINKGPRNFLSSSKDFVAVGNFFEIGSSEQRNSLQDIELIFKDLTDGSLSMMKSNSQDLILSQSTIRYVKDKKKMIEEFFRVLRPGGIAIFNLYNIKVLTRLFGKYKALEDYFTEQKVNGDTKFHYFLLKKGSDPNKRIKLPLKFSEKESRFFKSGQKHGWVSVYYLD